MSRAARPPLAAALLGLALALAAAATAAAQARDEVRRALAAGSYDQAIGLALRALQADPADPETSFLLARAYAYAGRRGEGEAVLDRLLARFPADADLLVFKARLLSWRGDLDGAGRTFQRALEVQPRSADALAGLADLAAWRGDLDGALVYGRRALDLDASHAQALFRTGAVLLWRGDYGRARGYLARAVELEPRNEDFARALATAAPVFARRAEVWLSGRNEHWSDGRRDYFDLGLAGLFSVWRDRARLVVKVDRLGRDGQHDGRFGLEIYPQLWRGAYGFIDIALAPKAEVTASSSFHLEVTQSVLTRGEASFGVRRVIFAGTGVTVLTSSAALYAGPWYPSARVYWADLPGGSEFTWMAGLRRYVAQAGYLWASLGRGARSFDTSPAEEVLAGPAWFFEAGFDLSMLKDLRLRGYASRRKESAGPSSLALALTLGYRF